MNPRKKKKVFSRGTVSKAKEKLTKKTMESRTMKREKVHLKEKSLSEWKE